MTHFREIAELMVSETQDSATMKSRVIELVQDALMTRELLINRGYYSPDGTMWGAIGPNLPHKAVPESEAFHAAVAKRTAELAALKSRPADTYREKSDQAVTIAEAAANLTTMHYEDEPGVTRIFLLTDSNDATDEVTPIKLLEVDETTPEIGVMPLYFGPAPASGVPYPSTIIAVTPREFEQIQTGTLKLPEGWSIGAEFPRPELRREE